MQKNSLKYLILTPCCLGALGSIPVASSICNKSVVTNQSNEITLNYNQDNGARPYNEKSVVSEMYGQFESVTSELVDKICTSDKISDEVKNDATKLQDIVNSDLTSLFTYIDENTPIKLSAGDPMDIFQGVLCRFHDECMTAICHIFHNPFVTDLIGPEKVYYVINLADDILSNRVSLKEHAKNNWSLQDIFEGILYPLCGSEEAAWELIFSVYSDTYYTGLNYNHANGQEIQGNYELIDTPTYTDQYAWNDIRKGDIIFSAQGFALGGHYSGHCAIVDGWQYARVQGTDQVVRYLRVIEANQFGVCYGLLDDVRIMNEQMDVLHVNSASDLQAASAARFAESQLGKHYNIPIFLSEDTSADTAAWYCSELVWAAYKDQGIDIQCNDYYDYDIPGILPWEVYYCSDAEIVTGFSLLNK